MKYLIGIPPGTRQAMLDRKAVLRTLLFLMFLDDQPRVKSPCLI